MNGLLVAGLLAAGGLFVALALFDRAAGPPEVPRATRGETAMRAPIAGASHSLVTDDRRAPARQSDTRAVAAGSVVAEASPIEPVSRPPRWSDFGNLREEGAREQDYLELYLDFVRRDPDEFRRGARDVVLGNGPTNEKTALLRAAYELDRAGAEELFRAALSEPGDGLPAERARLREFSVRYLGERCARDEPARALLRQAVWSDPEALEPPLRRRAAARLAAAIDPAELEELSTLLLNERDATVVEATLAGLVTNARTAAPPGLLARLGFDRDAFTPQSEVDR